MKKLFLALAMDEATNEAAVETLKKLKARFDQKDIEVRWARPENRHITLVFLGDQEEDRIPEIWSKSVQVASKAEAFSLKIAGVGAFPDAREARVLWLGVQKTQKLLDLQTELEKAIGVPQMEGYTPHITVGRMRNLKSAWDIIKPFAKHKFSTLQVQEVVLYESIQAGVHPVYKIIEKVSLREKIT